MFKALLRTRVQSYFNYMTGGGRGKKGTKKRGALYVLLFAYLFVMFAFLIGFFFNSVVGPFHALGLDWLYFAFYAMTSFALMVIFSIFMTQSQLYDAKDNELLLSMPIPSGYILGSRIAALVLENLVYGLVVAIPAAFVYLRAVPMEIGGIIAFVLITLMMPLFAFAITGIFSYFLHLVLSRFRNKTIFGVIFAMAFLLAYFYLYSRLNTYIQLLAASGQAVADSIATYARPVYWIGEAIASGNMAYLLLTAAMFLGAFVVVYAFLTATFRKSATTKRGSAKVVYRKREMKVSSAKGAIVRKELSRLFSSTVYLLNAAMGLILLAIGAVYIVIKRADVALMFSDVPGIGDIMAPLGTLLVCLMLSMSLFAAASISLEGRSIGILKAMPLTAAQILTAKADMHILLTVPFGLIGSAALIYVIDMSPVLMALTVILPVVFSLFTAYLGVAVNLRFPKLDWSSEAQVVKRGASIMICMFGTMLIVIIPPVIYGYFLMSSVEPWAALAAYTVIIAAAAIGLRCYLGSEKASARFYDL